jgi:hypothetical protein
MFVDAGPRSGNGAIADDALDAIAVAMNGQAAPLFEHFVAIEGTSESHVEMFDERGGGFLDTAEIARRHLANGDSVRPGIGSEGLDIHSDPDDQVDAIILNSRFRQDAGDFLSSDDDIVWPLDARRYVATLFAISRGIIGSSAVGRVRRTVA